MSDKKETKVITFKGKQYETAPEKVEKCCEGCELMHKRCYNDEKVMELCRQGFIFKQKK